MLKFKLLRDFLPPGAKCPFNFNIMFKSQGQVSLAVYLVMFILAIFSAFTLSIIPSQVSFMIILATIIFLIAFFNTNAAIVFLIFSMLLSPGIGGGAVGARSIQIRADDIFLFVIFLGWLAKMAVNKNLGLIHSNPLNNYIIFYILICLISTSWALIQGRLNLLRAIFFNLKYIEYFLIFFTVSNNLRSVKQAKRYIFLMLFTCFIICVYSWIQIPYGERLSAPFQEGGRGAEPGTLAGYLLLMMSIILGLAVYARSLKNRFLLLCFFGLAIVPFIFTLSRGGWLAFFPMCLAFIVLTRKYKIQLIFVFICLLVLLPLIMPSQVYSRIKESFAPEQRTRFMGKEVYLSESAVARLESWDVALKKLTQRPMLGHGVPGAEVIDNQFTRVLIETGLIGFFIFMLMILMIFRLVLYVYKSMEGNNFAQGLSLGFLSGLVGLLFQGFSAATFIIIRIMEPFWFLAALIIMLPEIMKNEDLQPA